MEVNEITKLIPEWIINSKKYAIAIINLEGNYIFVNDVFKKQFSLLEPDFIGLSYKNLIHSEDIEEFELAVNACLTNLNTPIEIRVRNHKNLKGSFYWANWELSPFKDNDAQVQGIICLGYDISDIENNRQESRDILEAIYNSTSEGNSFISADYKLLYVNRVTAEMIELIFGKKPQIGDDYLQYILPQWKEDFKRDFQKALKGENVIIEQAYGENNYRFSLFPVYNSEANLAGIAYNIRDITRRKQAESQLLDAKNDLQHKNQLLNAILESPKGMIIFSLDKNYCYLSFTKTHKETMQKIWGVEIEIGKNMLDYIKNENDRHEAQNNFDEVLSGTYFIQIEAYGDESLLRTYWEDRYSPMFDDKGEIIGLTVFVTDISERKRVEAIVKESERRLDILASNFPEGSISLVDKDLCLLYTGGMGYKIHAVSPKEMIGRPLNEAISMELFNQIVELLPAVWVGSTKTLETTFQDKIYLNTLQPIKNESGLVESFVLVASDITERKKNELKIIDQNKALKEIAWHQSHIVRRPVANILGLMNLIQTEQEEEGKYDLSYLEYLNTATKELDQIIEHIVMKSQNFE